VEDDDVESGEDGVACVDICDDGVVMVIVIMLMATIFMMRW
jgi:hypothetical protein